VAARLSLLLGLLVAEILLLTIRLDSQPLRDVDSVWAVAIGWSPQYLRLAITAALVTLLLGGRSLWTVFAHESRHVRAMSWPQAAALAVHLGALVVFARTSATLFAADGVPLGDVSSLGAIWFASAGATVIAWALVVLPVRGWRLIVGEHLGLLATGAAVGVVAWAFGFVSEAFWRPLTRQTYAVTAFVLRLLFRDVVSNPSTLELGTPVFSVEIAPECSGYEGIGLIFAFTSVYLFLSRRQLRFPAALLMLPLGAATIWLLNLARLVGLIAIGHAGYEDVALGGFHSQAGWLAFNLTGLGLVALVRRYGLFARERGTPAVVARSDDTSPYLMPFLTLLAMSMITGAFSAGFDWLYPIRMVALVFVLWAFRASYRTLRWRISWVSLSCGAAAFVVWMLLLPNRTGAAEGWPVALHAAAPRWALGWLVVRTLGYVIGAPIAEELAFRGYLTRRFWRTDDAAQPGNFAWSAFLLSSLVFGAFHGQLWLAGTLAGMLFALAMYYRRSIGDAVVAHALTNGLIAVYVFMTGRWTAWS
jgi:exosortase E/protease (VPEID-CTERM system)